MKKFWLIGLVCGVVSLPATAGVSVGISVQFPAPVYVPPPVVVARPLPPPVYLPPPGWAPAPLPPPPPVVVYRPIVPYPPVVVAPWPRPYHHPHFRWPARWCR